MQCNTIQYNTTQHNTLQLLNYATLSRGFPDFLNIIPYYPFPKPKLPATHKTNGFICTTKGKNLSKKQKYPHSTAKLRIIHTCTM